MKSTRKERFEALIKEKVSEIVQTEMDEFSDFFITITRVNMASDFMTARVYYSVFGTDEDKERLDKTFKKYKSRLRFALGNRIEFRRVPEFTYSFDENAEKAFRIDDLLNEVKDEIRASEELNAD